MNLGKAIRQNNTNNPHLLGRGDIKKLLLQYSFPAIIGNIVTSVYHIVDSIFIGHGIGALAISGMAVTFPIMNILAAFSMLIGVGGATLTSIRLGKKDEESARDILWHVAIVNTVNSVVLGALLLLFLDPILRLFGATDTLLPYARDFMSVFLYGIPINFVFLGLNNLMRVSGYPQKAMQSSFLTVAVNILLAPFFIFVLKWGMKGVALATVIAQFTGLVWVLYHFLNKKSFINFGNKCPKISIKIVGNIIAIGISPFLMNIVSSLVVSIINAGLIKHGGDLAVGAYGIINRVLVLFVMIVIGLTMGMQPVVGYNYGAKQIDRAFKALKYTIIGATSITTFGFMISQLFPQFIIKMFTTDAELVRISVLGLKMTTLIFPFVGAQIVISNFFQSVGKVRTSIFLSLTRQLIFLIPFLFILPHFFQLKGVFMSLPAADLTASVVTLLTFIYETKKMEREFGFKLLSKKR